MAKTGQRRDPLRGFRFRVKIPGMEGLGFTKVGGLKEETAIVTYREGEDPPTPRKLPGMTTYENIVLERGDGPGTEALVAWRREVHNASGPEAPEESMRREVIIEVLDKQGAPARRWNVTAAWPSDLDTSDLQATADEPVIRKLTLANEGVLEENIA